MRYSKFTTAAFSMVFLAAMQLGSTTSLATGFCNVKKTADGFVALRAGPSSKAKILGRMKSSDEVLIGLGQHGNWIEVTWWRGSDRFDKGYDHTSGQGWVNMRFIEEECG